MTAVAPRFEMPAPTGGPGQREAATRRPGGHLAVVVSAPVACTCPHDCPRDHPNE
jgi:hypothetical protein